MYVCLRRSCDEKNRHEIQDFNYFFLSLMRGLGRHWGDISSSSWGKETNVNLEMKLQRPYVLPDYLLKHQMIFQKKRISKHCRKSKRLKASWRKSSHIMAAILRSGKFLRLFSGVARYVAQDLLN